MFLLLVLSLETAKVAGPLSIDRQVGRVAGGEEEEGRH